MLKQTDLSSNVKTSRAKSSMINPLIKEPLTNNFKVIIESYIMQHHTDKMADITLVVIPKEVCTVKCENMKSFHRKYKISADFRLC